MSTQITDEKYMEWIAVMDHLMQVTQALYLHNSAKAAIEMGMPEAEQVVLDEDLVLKLVERSVELAKLDQDVTAMFEEQGLIEQFEQMKAKYTIPELEAAREKQFAYVADVINDLADEEE